MERRTFLALGGATLASVWPVVARAQQKLPRIGYLLTGSPASAEGHVSLDSFKQGMRELGYIDGQNIQIEVRAANSDIERFPVLANELINLKVDVIVASNSLAARAVKQASANIPTVVPVMGDPIGDGLVASLARPGGNITGLTFLGPQLVPKRLALLKEALPNASRIVALWHPGAYSEQTMSEMIDETKAAAKTLGVNLRLIPVRHPDELASTFSIITGEPVDAVVALPSPMLFNQRTRVVGLLTQHRLPSMSVDRTFVTIGGLLSYGADITDSIRLAATYVDKILKGAKPVDMPVEQPTKFEFCINLKTAKDFSVDLPAQVLARADVVIE